MLGLVSLAYRSDFVLSGKMACRDLAWHWDAVTLDPAGSGCGNVPLKHTQHSPMWTQFYFCPPNLLCTVLGQCAGTFWRIPYIAMISTDYASTDIMPYIRSNGHHEGTIQRHGQDTWPLSPKIETEVSIEEQEHVTVVTDAICRTYS